MTGGDLELAIRIAALADRQLMEGFRDPRLQSRTKSDGTPVTPVDAGVERMIRAELARGRPGDEVLGEEGEERPPAGSGRRWIVDPLDGTKNYLRGVPVFACLIALEAGGVLQLGVASAPALGLRWWAERGRGAFRDGTPISVSDVGELGRAELLHSGLGAWRRHGLLDSFLQLERASARTRGFGDFWPFLLVAEGAAEIAVEPGGLHVWDIAAPRMILEEAGGRFTSLAGGEPDGSVLASNGLVHSQAIAALAAA